MSSLLPPSARRVAITREEDPEGPLASALRARGFLPVACPVLVEAPSCDMARLVEAAWLLDRYDWVIAASARAVRALLRARRTAWPRALATAAVGPATAQAIRDAGVTHPVLVAAHEGADALWDLLAREVWTYRTVLVPTTPGGRTLLADRLREAGARVDVVEAYRMEPRPHEAIAADWAAAAPGAAVIASPRTAEVLAAAIGRDALRAVCVVAIGGTTAAALSALDVPCAVSESTSSETVAARVASGAVPVP